MAKQISSENRKPLIDATPKKTLTVSEVSEVSVEDLKKEVERLQESLERIRTKHFSSSAALARIEARSFCDIVKARIYMLQNKTQVTRKATEPKTSKG